MVMQLVGNRPEKSLKMFYTYTGREWDKETGLYYYRARYYDPMEGRFVFNNPINKVDPFGLAPKCEQDCLQKAWDKFLGCAATAAGKAQGICAAGCALACTPAIAGTPITYGACFMSCFTGCSIGVNIPRAICFAILIADTKACERLSAP